MQQVRRIGGLVVLAGLALAAAAGAGEGSGGAEAAPGGPVFRVVLRDQAPYFDPKRLRVPAGGTVVWENRGPALVHTIFMAMADGTVRSGSIAPGQSWSHTFARSEDAIVKAACEVHPYMYGMVIVGDPPDSLIAATEAAVPERGRTSLPAQILEFPLPVPDSVPDILAVDQEDNVWFTMGGGGVKNIDLPPQHRVGRLTIDGDLRVYDLPTEASVPNGLIVDGAGTVWITEFFGNKVARLDARRRILEEFEIPTPGAKPTGLVLDEAGNLWFSETGADKIGRLSPSGEIREIPIPTPGGHPTALVADAEGNLWFAERDASKIGCLRRDGGFVEYAIPTPDAKPAGMAVDAEGRVWFAERQGNRIGVVEDGRIREYPLPQPDSGPFFVLIDDEGSVWFTELFGDRIGRLDPATAEIVEYDLPSRDGLPAGLAMDSQGNLWFALQLHNKVGVLVRSPGAPEPPHVMPTSHH